MGNPVVHFEIIGRDPAGLRRFYGDLFGWQAETGGPVAESVSGEGQYGFIQPPDSDSGTGIPGGIGGGAGYETRTLFYVGVDNVEAALLEAERLGGSRAMGPERAPGGSLVVGHLRDPEGNLIGVAGIA